MQGVFILKIRKYFEHCPKKGLFEKNFCEQEVF